MDDPDYATSSKFNRMSPVAAVTSGLLHVMVAMALLPEWLPRHARLNEQAIEITVELAAPAAAGRPAPPAAAEHAAHRWAAASAGLEEAAPEREQQDAVAVPPPATEPDPALVLPSLEAPPPLAGRDFAMTAPSSVSKAPVQQPRAEALSPPQPLQKSPTRRASQQHVSDGLQVEARSAPSPSTEAGEVGHRKAQQDYLWQVIRRLSRYRFYPKSREVSEQGIVVTRLTVARDGRLLDVSLARSSGFPGLDKGVMDTIRGASPFAPLPADLADDRYTFVVPINYRHER